MYITTPVQVALAHEASSARRSPPSSRQTSVPHTLPAARGQAARAPPRPARAAQAPPPSTPLPRGSLPPRREKSSLGQSEAFPRALSAWVMTNGEPTPEARRSRRLTVGSWCLSVAAADGLWRSRSSSP